MLYKMIKKLDSIFEFAQASAWCQRHYERENDQPFSSIKNKKD